MKLDSKYNYMVSGLNVAFAFVGALEGSLMLIIMCVFFAVWNFYSGEISRRRENEEIRLAARQDDSNIENKE